MNVSCQNVPPAVDVVPFSVWLQVLSASAVADTRLEAMLVLGRLAARCVAVQQDAVREGAVPVLVDMMQQGGCRRCMHCACYIARVLTWANYTYCNLPPVMSAS
jgi:hypothetical protein